MDDVDAAFAELNGRPAAEGEIRLAAFDGARHRAFFVAAPDGLCYMIVDGTRPST